MTNLLKPFASLLLLFVVITSCNAQKVNKISSDNEKYILANIYKINYSFYNLYNSSFFVNVYAMFDSKATLQEDFEGTDEVLSSILISIMPDGDYYTTSKLYKIERLLQPKVLEINETTFPKFKITVEHGKSGDRIVSEYIFDGTFDN